MKLRNFWITTEVDGRSTKDGTGPKSDVGSFTTEFYMAEEGCSVLKLRVRGMVDMNGSLCIYAEFKDPEEVIRRVVHVK